MPANTHSSQETRKVQAACHCQRVCVDLTLPASEYPLAVTICHCNSCRHMTGLLCGTTGAYLPATYQPEESIIEKLVSYDFGSSTKHWFCPTCGTSIFGSAESSDSDKLRWLVSIGCLVEGDASIYTIKNHIFLEDTLDGGFSDFLKSFNGEPIGRYAALLGSETLPQYWASSSRPEPSPPKQGDKLYGYCHCKGVEFYLSAPSERSFLADEGYDDQKSDEEPKFWLRDKATRFRAANCPCNSCRVAANGQIIAQWAYVPTVDISLDPAGGIPIPAGLDWGTLKTYRTSEKATQHFCSRCGAVVFWNTDARPYLKDFGVGLFDSSSGARAEGWFRWKTNALRYREDTFVRSPEFTLALEEGLRGYAQEVQSSIPGHVQEEVDRDR